MRITKKRSACPLCRSDKGERILQIDQEQRMLAKKLNEARSTGNIGIKEMSALLDRMDELKQERLNIVSRAYNHK